MCKCIECNTEEIRKRRQKICSLPTSACGRCEFSMALLLRNLLPVLNHHVRILNAKEIFDFKVIYYKVQYKSGGICTQAGTNQGMRTAALDLALRLLEIRELVIFLLSDT